MERYIERRVNEILKSTNAKIVKRLEGGMSNYTYVVESDNSLYTFRVPGRNASNFVDRNVEKDAIAKVDQLGLNNQTIYFDIESGEKLAIYVDGDILSDVDISSYDKLSAETIKKLHNSDIVFPDYAPFERLEKYESYCIDLGYTLTEEYVSLRNQLLKIKPLYDSVEKRPCHCDFQPTNLVYSDNKLYVLDWEFAGMNDPYYDIACYGNAGIDKALSLLEAYIGSKPTNDDLKRLYFYRSFQCLQWVNVAIYKDLIGLSKDLNMNFNDIANMFLNFAKDLVVKINNL